MYIISSKAELKLKHSHPLPHTLHTHPHTPTQKQNKNKRDYFKFSNLSNLAIHLKPEKKWKPIRDLGFQTKR